MIGIVDYGMGNLGSVSNACAFLGLKSCIVKTPDELDSCRGLILPGVGAFGDCMAHLRAQNFEPVIKEWINADKPFLGICLGLQVLYEGSDESPGVEGLGLLAGRALRFSPSPERKVPQIGWNRVRQRAAGCPLFKDIPDHTYFYFVHSFYAPLSGTETDAGLSSYGVEYVSAIRRGRMAAVQFHPEKSQEVGLQMLKNFGEWAQQ